MSPSAETGAEWRAVIAGLQCLTLLPLALLVCDALGLAWSPALVWTALGPSILVAFGRWAPSDGRWRAVELGDLLAVAALAVFAGASWLEWNVHTDYIFHWGTKAERFALAHGLDLDFLTRPWNEHAHPDYPNGLPATLAAFAIVGGGYRWSAVAVLSIVHLGLLLLAVRELAAGASAVGRCVALATTAWGVAAFGVGFRQAGGADLPMAAAMAAAAVVLVGPADRQADRAVAWIAAFAAITKLEGMAFAVFLLGLHTVRRWWTGERAPRDVATLLIRSAGPTAVVLGVWAWTVFRHDLFLATNTGGLDLGRLEIVLPTLVRSLATVEWLGLPVVLLALPWLFVDRGARWAAALIAIQGSFYLYVYLSGPVDPEYYVVSTAARLALHLVPAGLVLTVVSLDRRAVESAAQGINNT